MRNKTKEVARDELSFNRLKTASERSVVAAFNKRAFGKIATTPNAAKTI